MRPGLKFKRTHLFIRPPKMQCSINMSLKAQEVKERTLNITWECFFAPSRSKIDFFSVCIWGTISLWSRSCHKMWTLGWFQTFFWRMCYEEAWLFWKKTRKKCMSKPNERWCRILLEKKEHFPPPVTPPPFF